MKLHRRPARALISAALALIVLFNLVSPALASPAEPAPASTSTPPSAVAVAPGSVGSISDQSAVAQGASAGSSSGARAPSPTASSAQADVISGLQADLSTGAAVTRYPINTPPARQGIGPSLALVYNSRQGNGWVGVGWDLSLGTIERSTRYGAPTYTTTDTFVWSSPAGGGELVYLGDDVYQLKIDTLFYKFVWYGNYWEVWDKSGVKYVYGQNKPSCDQMPYACVNNGLGVLQWNLSRIVDRYGNYMTVSYMHDQGQIYPQRMEWTGNESSGLAPGYSVDFGLEARNDQTLSYRSGSSITTAQRLASVNVMAGSASIRTYRLTYTYSPQGLRSVLTRIQEVGSDGVTQVPATDFTYHWPYLSNPVWQQADAWAPPCDFVASYWGILKGDTGCRIESLNGDGLPDALQGLRTFWNNSVIDTYRAWLNTGPGWSANAGLRPPELFAYAAHYDQGPTGIVDLGMRPADVNGDGFTDLLQAYGWVPGATRLDAWTNSGLGWTANDSWLSPSGYFVMLVPSTMAILDQGRRLADINGDGLPDHLVAKGLDGYSVRESWINNGAGWMRDDRWNIPSGYFAWNARTMGAVWSMSMATDW